MIERRVYDYLGEVSVALEGPSEMLDLCQKNIEEKPRQGESDGGVKIIKGKPEVILKNKDFPYAWLRETNTEKGVQWDYFRYGTLTRSYSTVAPNSHITEYHLENDSDGPLKCFLKIYFDSKKSENKDLVHGTSLIVDGKGLLIAGPCWSGKTSTSFKLIDFFGGELIAEGTSLLSSKEGKLTAHYLPKSLYARFSLIHKLPKLSALLDQNNWDVQQYFDLDALERIIKAKKFDLDAGIRVTRAKASEIMQMKTRSSGLINKIIFTKYGSGAPVTIERLPLEKVVENLRANEFVKERSLGKVENQVMEQPPLISRIDKDWLGDLEGVLLTYNGLNDLTPDILRRIVE